MKKHLLKFGFIGALLLLVPAQGWADMVDITVQNGSWNGFSATFIHKGATGPGKTIFGRLDGTLWGNLTTFKEGQVDYLKLSGINGILKDTTGSHKATLEINSGMITSGPGFAFGSFNYDLKDDAGPYAFNISGGTFTFASTQPANSLTMNTLQLWGGDTSAPYTKTRNGNVYNRTGIGMDFRANITPKPQIMPEPASLILFGTGLAALGFLRYRKFH